MPKQHSPPNTTLRTQLQEDTTYLVQRRLAEYQALQAEIAALRAEAADQEDLELKATSN